MVYFLEGSAVYERLLARVHDTSVSYRGVWLLYNQNRRIKSLYNLFAMEAQRRHNSEFVIETNLLNLIHPEPLGHRGPTSLCPRTQTTFISMGYAHLFMNISLRKFLPQNA